MKPNNHHSYNLHKIAKACQLCVKGRKSVLYLTGLCPRDCYYCPLSDTRKNKDVIFINERKIRNIKQIIEEIKLSKSKGVGITGGDPLLKLKRTITAIKLLKKVFSNNFHIHLYTSLNLITKASLSKLSKAGLDELRLHPDLDNKALWKNIKSAKNYPWKLGIEIPSIPGYYQKAIELITLAHNHIDFLNINELEISDTNTCKLQEHGFKTKDKISYAIKGSHQQALKLLQYIKAHHPKLPVHYCTARLKDSIQLKNRLILRAKNIKKPYELVSADGMLIRGIIFANQKTAEKLKQGYKIPSSLISYNKANSQILIAPWILLKIRKKLKQPSVIRAEYPTHDRLLVEEN
ncbi:MAG TPA: radical SAM protein [Candidatus Nanoarchaeia archaeon]|nr:radical SAM protein [Candidatus Nanoarchaeia archaeon]